MKILLAVFVIITALTLGCSQSDHDQKGREATPIPNDKITEMDFESGEVEQPTEVTDDEGDSVSEDGE